jgi:hypothetical protein
MTISVDPKSIIWSTFNGLEPPAPDWARHIDYWEDYTRRFFGSNGKEYTSQDSNVARWLSAPDRAPFVHMLKALLPLLKERADLSDVDLVIVAHWFPDIHLGTSVSNFALHYLGLENGFGFAISDRGLSAPFFALHCIDRYLVGDRKKALLITMDQKHLLYNSSVVAKIDPYNSASMMVLRRSDDGVLRYRGYCRNPDVVQQDLGNEIWQIATRFGIDATQSTLIADPDILRHVEWAGPTHAQNRRLLCTAPFAVLADHAADCAGHLLVSYQSRSLSAIYFSVEEGRRK